MITELKCSQVVIGLDVVSLDARVQMKSGCSPLHSIYIFDLFSMGPFPLTHLGAIIGSTYATFKPATQLYALSFYPRTPEHCHDIFPLN